MGLLDGLLGGAVGAGVVTALNSLIQQHGGVQGVVDAARAAGTRQHGALLGLERPESAASPPSR